MRTKKKIFPMRTTMLLLLMVLTSLSAWAQNIVASGNCGDIGINGGADVTWTLTGTSPNYTLTISGTGPMMYYGSALGGDDQYHSTAPWSTYESEIEKVVVGSGVTYIGSYAFAYCSALTSISLPSSVTVLGNYVCYGSSNGSTNLRIDIPTAVAVTIGNDGFEYCQADLQIAVPAHLLKTYKEATNWSKYAAKMVGVLDDAHDFNTGGNAPKGSYEYTRTFKEGVAATLCLPFEVSSDQISLYGQVYTFAGVDKSGELWEVVMQEANKTSSALTAYRPYLFLPYIFNSKGKDLPITFHGNVASLAIAGNVIQEEDHNIGSFWTFQGVTYYYAWNEGHANLGKIYGFAAQNYSTTVNPGDFVKAAAGANIAPFRAFLQFTSGVSSAPRRGAADQEALPSRMSVRLVDADGTVTAIGNLSIDNGQWKMDNWMEGEWYTLDGRRLNSAPSTRGIYMKNGKKVIVK